VKRCFSHVVGISDIAKIRAACDWFVAGKPPSGSDNAAEMKSIGSGTATPSGNVENDAEKKRQTSLTTTAIKPVASSQRRGHAADPRRPSSRATARYCGDDCRQAVRRVLDRERKWLRRNTYAGHFKRRMEYQQERARRAVKPETRTNPASGTAVDGDPTGRQLFGFL
jgi:hypothetical protein